MKLLTLSFFLFLIFQYTFAGIVGDTRITGRVLRYDKKTVTLSQHGNREITVPKNLIEKDFKKLKTGLLVTAVFSAEEMMNQIQQQAKQKETKTK